MKIKAIEIEVPKWIIERSQIADSGHCMIADAIKEAMPGVRSISVDLQTIRFSEPATGKRYIYWTPTECQEHLIWFDQGIPVKPWRFKLPCRPCQVLPMRKRQEDGTQVPRGPRKVNCKKEAANLIVEGGHALPSFVLSHQTNGTKPKRRIFGIRAAKGFSPVVERE